MKTIIALLVLVLVFQTARAEEATTDNSTIREQCLSGYTKYIEILRKTYQVQISKFTTQQAEKWLDHMVVYIVQKCQSDGLKQQPIQTFLQTLSKQTKENLTPYLIGNKAFETILSQTLDQNQQTIYKQVLKVKSIQNGIVIFGYNLKKLPKSAKYYYLAVYTLVAIGALVYGLKDMENKRQAVKRD